VDLLTVRWRQHQAREDRRAVFGGWMLANINRDSEQRSQPFTLDEVTTWMGHGFQRSEAPPIEELPTVEELAQRVRVLNTVYNGEVT
jgi:hypothetical protein